MQILENAGRITYLLITIILIAILYWFLRILWRKQPKEPYDIFFWGNQTEDDLARLMAFGVHKENVVSRKVSISNIDIDALKNKTISWLQYYKPCDTRITVFDDGDMKIYCITEGIPPYLSTYLKQSRIIEISFKPAEFNVNVKIRQYPAQEWIGFNSMFATVYWIKFIEDFLEVFGSSYDKLQTTALLSEREKKLRDEEFNKHSSILWRNNIVLSLGFFIVFAVIGLLGIYWGDGSRQDILVWISLCLVMSIGIGVISIFFMRRIQEERGII